MRMISHNKSRPLRILLVEDSEHDILAFRRALQKSSTASEITHYIRAEDALERLIVDASRFDLIVTDYKLPGMSGLELCRELLVSKVALPIVMLIGTASNGLAVDALKAGVDDYLIKDPDQGYLNQLPVILSDAVRKHSDRLASKQPDEGFVYSETRYPIIIEDQTELIRCFSLDGILTFVNDAYCRFFNEKREQLIGQHFMQFVPIEDQETIKRHLTALGRNNAVKTIEHRVVRPDGDICWQEWTDRAVFNGQGLHIAFQSIGRDISEKKQMEEIIQQGDDRYHSLIEITPNGFFICDITSGDILLVNQKACDLFGYAMQEMLTCSLWDLIAVEEQDTLQERIQTQRHEETLKLPNETYTMRHKDGTTFGAELFSSLITFDGNLVLQGIIRKLAT